MPCHIFHIFPLSLIKSSYLAPGEGPPSLIWTPCARHPAPGARHPAPGTRHPAPGAPPLAKRRLASPGKGTPPRYHPAAAV